MFLKLFKVLQKDNILNENLSRFKLNGTTALSIITLGIMILSITILSITTFNTMTLSIMTLSITKVIFKTLSITSNNIMKQDP